MQISVCCNLVLRFVAKKENVHSKALQKRVQLAFLLKAASWSRKSKPPSYDNVFKYLIQKYTTILKASLSVIFVVVSLSVSCKSS